MKTRCILKNKKGLSGAKITGIIGALIVVVMLTALSTTMFSGANTTGGPTWVNTVLPIIIGAGIISVAWKAFK